jgi:hypothetical protein
MLRLNPLKVPREWLSAVSAIAAGAVIWFSMRILTGENNPARQIDYWVIGYPLTFVASLALGYLFPIRPGRLGVYILAVQFILTLITEKGDLNLLPPAAVIYLILAIPLSGAAYLGAWLSKRFSQRTTPKQQ